MGDLVAFQAAGVIEVELLEAFARRESGGLDPALAAVRLPGRCSVDSSASAKRS
jgi:hypothetical protein